MPAPLDEGAEEHETVFLLYSHRTPEANRGPHQSDWRVSTEKVYIGSILQKEPTS